MFKLLAALGAAALAAAPVMAQSFDPIGEPERPVVPIGGLVQTFPASVEQSSFGEAAVPQASAYGSSLIVYLAGETMMGSFAPTELMAERFDDDAVLSVQQAYQLSTVFSQIEDVQGGLLAGPQLVDPDVAPPIPEAHEWAMMAAGLGVVGWAARRRKRRAIEI